MWSVLVAAALIVLRSWLFLQYEQADFDADQAIVGLMAMHLAEGRAWPLFFYGQLYMLGVQAWLAAPFILWLGPTVLALKLPLLLLNIATAVLLIWRLVRDAGLRAWQAWVASLWFVLLPPVTASRMVQAQGGTIEPLCYTLVLWLLRRRAVAFGLVFALGFLQREFTLFGVVALVLVEGWSGQLWTRQRAVHWLVVATVFLGARECIELLRHVTSMFGPDAAPPRLADGVTNVDLVARNVCLAPGHVLGNLQWLVTRNVPTFFGGQVQPAGFLIASSRPTGTPASGIPALLAVAAALVVIGIRWRALAPRSRPRHDVGQPRPGPAQAQTAPLMLPLVLVSTGVLGLLGVASGCSIRSEITIRYHLLLALAPVGLTALCFVLSAAAPDPSPASGSSRRRTRVWLPTLVLAGVAAWACAMAVQHAALWREYRTRPPASPYRVLADDLVAHGDRVGWASYWVAYHVDFLAAERVQLSPTSAIRISDYARQALQAGPKATVVGNEPCDPADRGARRVLQWWVCRRE